MFDVCVATLIDDMYVCVMLNKYVEYIGLIGQKYGVFEVIFRIFRKNR